jgi:hypothetical protein
MHTLITQLQPSKALAQVQHSQSGGITCTASYFKLSTASDSKLHGTLPAGPASGRRCTPSPSTGACCPAYYPAPWLAQTPGAAGKNRGIRCHDSTGGGRRPAGTRIQWNYITPNPFSDK